MSGTSFASDLDVGDVFRDRTGTTWWRVVTVAVIRDGIHVECDDKPDPTAEDPEATAA